MKKVLLVTDGLVHPPLTARNALRDALFELTEIEFERINSLEKLPDGLNQYSALVLYFHHKEISQGALSKLDEYVSGGGGILGVHTATASFKQQLGYFKILGGRFIGHGKVEPFEVAPIADSAIFAGFSAFTVKDELYLHELEPGITVHFTAQHEGLQVPAVWTYSYGEGRVCYAAPGHRTETLKNETYQKLLRQGLKWVTGE
jgi:type 1 glutamine amidotransferase